MIWWLQAAVGFLVGRALSNAAIAIGFRDGRRR